MHVEHKFLYFYKNTITFSRFTINWRIFYNKVISIARIIMRLIIT